MKRRGHGFTLIELIVTLVIVGILTAIAIPSYQSYVLRSNRSVASRLLLDIANREERYYLANRSYTSDLTQLGYGAQQISVDSNGSEVPSTSASRIYLISVTAANASGYTLNAAAQNRQTKDTGCTTMTINQTATKVPSSGCW